MKFMQKLRKSAKGKKGFTLIELIIVIAIIAILIALIAPNLIEFLGTAKKTSTEANAKTSYTSLQTYVTKQFAAGSPVAPAEYIIYSNGTTITVKIGATDATLDGIEKYFNPKEIKDVTITANISTDGVTSVKWKKGTDPEVTYPK